ncbi:hypothetical protein ONZ45_g3059 [Pleurotus djamor]|nr:hypothetical protein ONZ45_g3059 [Pleurotus djamor]
MLPCLTNLRHLSLSPTHHSDRGLLRFISSSAPLSHLIVLSTWNFAEIMDTLDRFSHSIRFVHLRESGVISRRGPQRPLPVLSTIEGSSEIYHTIAESSLLTHLAFASRDNLNIKNPSLVFRNVKTLSITIIHPRYFALIAPHLVNVELLKCEVTHKKIRWAVTDLIPIPSRSLKYLCISYFSTDEQSPFAYALFARIPSLQVIRFAMMSSNIEFTRYHFSPREVKPRLRIGNSPFLRWWEVEWEGLDL